MSRKATPRDPVETVRTKYWYEGLRIWLRASTAYAVERRIEPSGFGKNHENIPYHRNKWSRYRRGKHTPNATMINHANEIAPNSRSEINHVLWQALLDEPMTFSRATKLLRQVGPELQAVMFSSRLEKAGYVGYFESHAWQRLLRKIEHRASIDALACLTILLRLNHSRGHDDDVWDFSFYIFRMLLILGADFHRRDIATELFQIYRDRVFSLAKYNEERYVFDQFDYVSHSIVLDNCALEHITVEGRHVGDRERLIYRRQTLANNIGFDLNQLFDSVIFPDRRQMREEERQAREERAAQMKLLLESLVSAKRTPH